MNQEQSRISKTDLVPLYAEKLTAGVPQPPRRFLASALRSYEGRRAVAGNKRTGLTEELPMVNRCYGKAHDCEQVLLWN